MLLISTVAFAAEKPVPFQQSVQSFYDYYLQSQPFGIPSQKNIKAFTPWLSASLIILLSDASKAEERYQKKTKNESPPLVEGDIFTSLFEGANGFKIISSDAKTNSCTVEFTYTDPGPVRNDIDGSAQVIRWKDKIFCVHESTGWKIDDIEYGGTWQFMHRGRLRDLLKHTQDN
jgi:hypothetical protein